MSKAQIIQVTGSPFGTFNVVRQEGEPKADLLIGYVDHGDGRLMNAIWKDGRWRSRSLRPLAREVVAWWRMEKIDGTPFF